MTARRAWAWGALAVAAWAGLAAVSGALSPLARRPLLDGLIPVEAYRWVEPPEALADGNDPPEAGTFELAFDGRRSEPDVVFTADDQVTVIAPAGMVVDDDASSLELAITPVGPSAVGALPGELEPFGNVVRIDATVEPGGPVGAFDESASVILVYPASPELHATEHVLLWSDDGERWTELDSSDAIALQQVEGRIDAPGFVVVGGVPSPLPVPAPADDGANDALSTILLVVAGASLLIGIGLLIRARGTEG